MSIENERYSLEEAQNEAEVLRKKVESGEAKDYAEAERQAEQGKGEKQELKPQNLIENKVEDMSDAEELAALLVALDKENVTLMDRNEIKNNPKKLSLYKDIVEVLQRHGKITEWVVEFLASKKIDINVASKAVTALITELEQSKIDPNRRGSFIRNFISDRINQKQKTGAKIDSNDPRYSENMRISYAARRDGHYHRKAYPK